MLVVELLKVFYFNIPCWSNTTLSYLLQKKHLVNQNEEISSKNASLQTENETLRSELDLLNADYEVLQEEMNEAKEHYKDLDMSATKIAHRCEVVKQSFLFGLGNGRMYHPYKIIRLVQ